MSGPGHNSGVNNDALRQHIERIERINSEIADLMADRKELFAAAKGDGFDTAILRKLIAIRKKDEQKRKEENELLSLYGSAVGIDPFS